MRNTSVLSFNKFHYHNRNHLSLGTRKSTSEILLNGSYHCIYHSYRKDYEERNRRDKEMNYAKLKELKLKTVGWGSTYDEVKDGEKYVTSCMTDHNGPFPYNFQPCNLPGVIKHIPNDNYIWLIMH